MIGNGDLDERSSSCDICRVMVVGVLGNILDIATFCREGSFSVADNGDFLDWRSSSCLLVFKLLGDLLDLDRDLDLRLDFLGDLLDATSCRDLREPVSGISNVLFFLMKLSRDIRGLLLCGVLDSCGDFGQLLDVDFL